MAAPSPTISDHSGKYNGLPDENIEKKESSRQVNRFPVDHLKTFFEQEMDAREMSPNITIADAVRQICSETPEKEIDEPFYMVNLSYICRQYYRWNHYMGKIHPFYAVKSNPSGIIVRVLNKLGTGFDCASAQELDVVRENCGANFDYSTRVIYAHPCKQVSHIQHFRAAGVQLTVVDNSDEMIKLSVHWPEAKVLLRLKPDDTHSLNPLSSKFGASEEECIELLKLGRRLNTNIVGCTFHVGSRCYDPQVFAESIRLARRVFDVACSDEFGYNFSILDIGGGFMGNHTEEPTLSKVSFVIKKTLNNFFPEHEGVRIVAEPGRYFSSTAITLVCRVIGRRIANHHAPIKKAKLILDSIGDYSDGESYDEVDDIQREEDSEVIGVCDEQPLPILVPLSAHSWAEGHYMTGSVMKQKREKKNVYYINDGIYGTFNAIVFDQKSFIIHYLHMSSKVEENGSAGSENHDELFKSVIFGPTCDSLDCVAHAIDLPLLNINDVLWFPDVGSYTSGSSSNFNGFKTKKFVLFWNQ